MRPTPTRPTIVRTARRLAFSAIAMTGAVGCGGAGGKATAHLQGTVTLAGKPLPADAIGTITFIPTSKDQAPAATAEIAGGNYDCPAAPQGSVRVSFNITQPTGPEYTTDRGGQARQLTNIVPDKYAAGVDVEVTGDDAAFDFDME
jgi:hypothetical protein